ncbi:MAG: hypothetical protein GX852_02930 [Clostridiales bacterium]|nr:hypothetical protein [Clostridiales bacterium]
MKNTVKFGTLMTVLLLASLCSLILMLLTLSTSLMDRRISLRYSVAVTWEYNFESLGQEWLANVDDVLAANPNADLTAANTKPDDNHSFSIESIGERKYRAQIGDSETKHLIIEIQVDDKGIYKVTKWAMEPQEIQKQTIKGLVKVN